MLPTLTDRDYSFRYLAFWKFKKTFLNLRLNLVKKTPSAQTNKLDLKKNPEFISAGGGFGPVSSQLIYATKANENPDRVSITGETRRLPKEISTSFFPQGWLVNSVVFPFEET